MAAAAPPVRGYGPASSSVALYQPRLRARIPASFAPVTTRRAASARLRAVVTDAPRGLQLHRREDREVGLMGRVWGSGEEEEEAVEKVDGWIRESISEIVRHIEEAPFLVHLFNSDDGGERVTMQREPAAPESWPDVRRRWGPGGRRRPDGIILVEQVAAAAADGGGAATQAARQVWGLVVQARGMECASCYVLDTCRVRSSVGFCTHFCLARAQCFGDPVELQLRNAWLNRLSGRR